MLSYIQAIYFLHIYYIKPKYSTMSQFLLLGGNKQNSLGKIPQFHQIFWCGNFVERQSFHIVSGNSPETMRKLSVSTKFSTRKLCEIMVFYAVIITHNIRILIFDLKPFSMLLSKFLEIMITVFAL